jgi:hypothetical protein
MIGLLCFALTVIASPFKSKLRVEAENAVLRHQLIVLRPRLHGASGSRTMIAGSSGKDKFRLSWKVLPTALSRCRQARRVARPDNLGRM